MNFAKMDQEDMSLDTKQERFEKREKLMTSAKAIVLQMVQKIKQEKLKKGEKLSAKAILLQMIRKIREKPAAKAILLQVMRKIKQEKFKKESAKMDQEDLSLFQMSGNKKG